MIYPQHSFEKLNDHITMFDIKALIIEELKLMRLLEPVQELLESCPKHSIHLYKSSGLFHSEAEMQVGEKYASANSVEHNLEDNLSKLVPKSIKSTSTTNLFLKNNELETGNSYELTAK